MRVHRIALRFLCIASVALILSGSLMAAKLFQPTQIYRSGGLTAISIASADMNGDAKPDLVVVNVCFGSNNCDGGVGVLLGNGDGTFQNVKNFDSGVIGAGSAAVADLNHDGKPDVVISHLFSCSPTPCSGLISVLLGKGDGTLEAPHHYPSGGYQAENVVIADVNGDGKLDLLEANACAGSEIPCISGGAVGVLLGNGDGTFGATQTYNSVGPNGTVAVADANQDGKLDLLVLSGSLYVLLGNGDGTFQSPAIYDLGVVGSGLFAVGDVNGDGKPDLLATERCFDNGCTGSAAGVLIGNGDGTFQAEQKYSTGAPSVLSGALADVNGDGNLDLVVGHYTGALAVLLGNGDGTFKTALRYNSGGRNANAIAMADVNGDAKPDVLVGNKCFTHTDCTSGGVGVLLGNAAVRTTTNLRSSANPSIHGHGVTFTATITSIGPHPPTGKVKFWDGTVGIGSATLSGSVAALTKSNLAVGTHPITAQYLGDADSAKSTSSVLNQVVQ
jgi:Big-like domain-containing protein/VCBS repeat protein